MEVKSLGGKTNLIYSGEAAAFLEAYRKDWEEFSKKIDLEDRRPHLYSPEEPMDFVYLEVPIES